MSSPISHANVQFSRSATKAKASTRLHSCEGRVKPLNDRHRGIHLMSTIMDAITYNSTGNEVTMTRNAITGMAD